MTGIPYYLAMLSVLLIDWAITAAYAGLSGNTAVIGQAAGASVLILGVVNLAGAWLLFRPVGRWLAGRGDAEAARRRIARLPLVSTLWVGAVALAYGVTVFRLGVFTPDEVTVADLRVRVGMFVWFLFVYATYMCFVVYFAVTDLTASLRERWTEREGRIIAARRGRLVFRLIAVFAVVTAMPAALVILDLAFFQEVRRLQGLTLEQTVFLDLIGALAAAGLSLVFVTRSVVRPIDRLMAGLGRVGSGDLSGRMAVTTDDELGVLTSAFNRMVDGLAERAFVRETFGKYVPAAVADRILGRDGLHAMGLGAATDRDGAAGGEDAARRPPRRAGSDGRLAGDTVEATVMFVDLEQFTRLAEAMAPARVLDLLNEYLAAIADPIERHGGVINSFIGDAVLVSFDLPAPIDPARADHADRAVACARDILDLLDSRRFDDGVRLSARIGINTGPVVAGSVGPADRLAFTVLGDTVNLAARLEGLNRQQGTRILLGEGTRTACRGSHAFRPVGPVPIRGRAEPVRAWAVAGTAAQATDGTVEGKQPEEAPPVPAAPASGRRAESPPHRLNATR